MAKLQTTIIIVIVIIEEGALFMAAPKQPKIMNSKSIVANRPPPKAGMPKASPSLSSKSVKSMSAA